MVHTVAKRGPKTRLNPELIQKICAVIREGNYPTTAAALYGVPPTTLAMWRDKGRKKPHSVYGALVGAILEAESEAERELVDVVVKAAKDNGPKWALNFLGRRWADRYGRRDNVEVSAVNVTVDLDALKARLLAKLEAWRPTEPPATPTPPEPTEPEGGE